jgi:hypothetical protein
MKSTHTIRRLDDLKMLAGISDSELLSMYLVNSNDFAKVGIGYFTEIKQSTYSSSRLEYSAVKLDMLLFVRSLQQIALNYVRRFAVITDI